MRRTDGNVLRGYGPCVACSVRRAVCSVGWSRGTLRHSPLEGCAKEIAYVWAHAHVSHTERHEDIHVDSIGVVILPRILSPIVPPPSTLRCVHG